MTFVLEPIDPTLCEILVILDFLLISDPYFGSNVVEDVENAFASHWKRKIEFIKTPSSNFSSVTNPNSLIRSNFRIDIIRSRSSIDELLSVAASILMMIA